MNTINIDGRRIAYLDIGRGVPVILAHCSSASHREWTSLIADLSTRYRVLAPDLIGYGQSEAWSNQQSLDPMADANVILGLAELAGGPVHLAGHSYGAAVALEAARVLGRGTKSLTLVEPVAFHLLRQARRVAAWAEVCAVGGRVQAAVQMGRPRQAAAAYMSFWIGRMGWWVMPAKRRRAIVATVGKVAAEFGIMEEFQTTLAEYAGVGAPVRLIVGGRTRRPARAVTEVLMQVLPNAHDRVLPRAGHMSPYTHAADIRSLIVEHIDLCETAMVPRHAAGRASGRFPWAARPLRVSTS